ncbi:MAG: GNAT family N-acetyltransferase [Bacteroidales bacterium]|nr:GNAT family N-acetyltransferase [Bacteroidales bacterium]MCF8343129.1 GNAT family N-acetyltransferase [Bacteroidales bacterium]MCF8351267.1 GNAT family N-acetyltransferase [Bacteroidales bacterium]MCF8376097.1 GNAT family N-acetyltransferase [Bacteroidales bacterium]MCF8400370.1 GNAT family N-acetyltransferase [Bacteroidales bacterium]
MTELKILSYHSRYNKNDFDCGNEGLNHYLQKQAGQDLRKKLSVCYVLLEDKIIKGYYTLSNAGISQENIPKEILKKLPRSYKQLPVTLLGRLAIDLSVKGKGFGELLIIDAMKKCLMVATESIGSFAVVVDPIDQHAVAFFNKYGFIELSGSRKMFLPMKTIMKLFANHKP